MSDLTPRLSLGDLARQALATAPAARSPILLQLAHGTRTAEQTVAIADVLLSGGKTGPAAALQWLARVPPALPSSLIARFIPLLGEKSIPSSVRVTAAARLIRDLPDKTESIRPIVKSLNAGLPPLRALERLRHLQHQVDRGGALDQLIERREKRVKMDCPRCGVRLPRIEMVKHLWFVHGVFLERGKVREPASLASDAREEFTRSADPEALDRGVIFSGINRLDELRSWVATTKPTAQETAPLRARAEAHTASLCPGCLTPLHAPVPPLPPPLNLTKGRLSGEGYLVEIGGASWYRTLLVETPDKLVKSGLDRGHTLSPRGAAMLVACFILLVGAAIVLFLHTESVKSMPIAVGSIIAAILIYAVVFIIHKPIASRSDRAIDVAWSILGRRLVQRDRGMRFLTRLCLTSIERGNPVERVSVLQQVLGLAEETASESDAAVQLLAAARVLQAYDEGRDPDRAAVVAGLAAAGFRSEAAGGRAGNQFSHGPPLRGGTDYAEHVVAAFLTTDPDPGELARLRYLLLAAAFEAGLGPRELRELWAVAPHLRRAMLVEPLAGLGLLYGLWTIRRTGRLEKYGSVGTIYDLCRTDPKGSEGLLRENPDLLLRWASDSDAEADIGPLLVCRSGIVIGGKTIPGSTGPVKLTKAPDGRYLLQVGRHRFDLARPPLPGFGEAVQYWLSFQDSLRSDFTAYLQPGPPGVADRVLTPFRLRCGKCGTVSVVAVGQVGTPVAGR